VLAQKSLRHTTAHDSWAERALVGLREFAVMIAVVVGPLVAMVVLSLRRWPAWVGNDTPAIRLAVRTVTIGLVMSLLPIVILGGTKVQDRWIVHLVAIVPMALLAGYDSAAISAARIRHLAIVIALLGIGYTVARGVQWLSPPGQGRGWHPIKWDESALAAAIVNDAGTNATVLTYSRQTAGNLKLLVPTLSCSASQQRPLFMATPTDGPIVIVWESWLGTDLPHFFAADFATLLAGIDVSTAVIHTVPATRGDVRPECRFNYAVIERH
jgi:hypothetical protein